MSNRISKTPCDRLLYALGLEQTGEYYRTFFTQVSDMLEVRMSTFSDCIRRGKIVTGPVLEAVKAKGTTLISSSTARNLSTWEVSLKPTGRT